MSPSLEGTNLNDCGDEFRCVVVDPPWRYRDGLPGPRRGAESHYPCLSLAEIEDLVRRQLTDAAPDAHLYCWTTNAFMPEAWRLCELWDFTPRTILTWVKPSIGMGHYYRNNTEHVVFAVRGTLPTLQKDQPTAFFAPRLLHSEKPAEFFRIVERMSPGPRLELFARKPREGWTVWGNEVNV